MINLTKILFLISFTLLTTISKAQKQPNIPESYIVNLNIIDNESENRIDSVYLQIVNITKKTTDSVLVIGGFISFTINKGFQYLISTSRKRYVNRKGNFDAACYLSDPSKVFCAAGLEINSVDNTNAERHIIDANIRMIPLKIGTVLKIDNIRYDLDRAEIKQEEGRIMDGVIALMKENPEIIIELGSHTDSRANDDYNMVLSKRRALAAVSYMVEKGIEKSRINAKGYGESMLLNKCDDGVPCSESEHNINRRTEIKVTGIKKDGTSIELKGKN
jgi:outer membrane protein OmpA-like peptidoglycan-associated protein